MLSESQIKIAIVIISLVSLFAMVVRYIKNREKLLLDGATYILLLSLLYVTLPAYVHLDTRETVLKVSFQAIMYSAQYSVYFVAVIAAHYVFSTFACWDVMAMKCVCCHGEGGFGRAVLLDGVAGTPRLLPIGESVIYALYGVIVLYIAAIYLFYFPSVKVLWSNRVLASIFATPIYLTYKITFCYYIAASLSLYLCFKNRSSKYLLMLLPFVLLNLATSDRDFLYSTLLLTIGVRSILREELPLSMILVVAIILATMSTVRATWRTGIQLERLASVPGEFLLTTEGGYLLIESRRSVDVGLLAMFPGLKIVAPALANTLLGGNPSFSGILAKESSGLHFGLGGSLLCEVYSAKSRLLEIAYPFLVIAYAGVMNRFLRIGTFFGVLVFLFFLAGTHSLFRMGVIYFSWQPFYYCIYAGAWYWVSRLLYERKTLMPVDRPLAVSRHVHAG